MSWRSLKPKYRAKKARRDAPPPMAERTGQTDGELDDERLFSSLPKRPKAAPEARRRPADGPRSGEGVRNDRQGRAQAFFDDPPRRKKRKLDGKHVLFLFAVGAGVLILGIEAVILFFMEDAPALQSAGGVVSQEQSLASGGALPSDGAGLPQDGQVGQASQGPGGEAGLPGGYTSNPFGPDGGASGGQAAVGGSAPTDIPGGPGTNTGRPASGAGSSSTGSQQGSSSGGQGGDTGNSGNPDGDPNTSGGETDDPGGNESGPLLPASIWPQKNLIEMGIGSPKLLALALDPYPGGTLTVDPIPGVEVVQQPGGGYSMTLQITASADAGTGATLHMAYEAPGRSPAETSVELVIRHPMPEEQIREICDKVYFAIDEARRANGLYTPLNRNDEMDAAAQTRAAEISVKFSSTRPNGEEFYSFYPMANPTNYFYGENIAKGVNTPGEAVQSWMASGGHRDQILDETYTDIGIGAYRDNDLNYYWVLHFYRP